LQALSVRSYHIDELFDLLSFNISEISSALAILEIKGVVRDRGGKNYEKA
jgi:predicted Rossmann fold nucleotide-binding protein DprA/Smf involved in DNA uptake